ncbi:MerR family transcriptional regulator [Alicyclobacillus sp. ALC3]|nr:MerR family transcriptional regulator [Alicyclobacillus sp. ALC3]
MKIRELAKRTGLTAYTVRYYEKEGLLDSRHVQREENNYRNYTDEALDRLRLIKKFQGIGCSLAELKGILQDIDSNSRSNLDIIEWIVQKMKEVEQRKDELDHMLSTLRWMLEYRMGLMDSDEKNSALLERQLNM